MVKKNSRGLRRGYIINFEEAVESIRGALDDAERITKLKIKNVVIGISGVTLESKIAEGSVAFSRPDSELTSYDLERALEASQTKLGDIANKTILERLPLEYKVDGKKVLGQPETYVGSKLDVKTLFITYSNQHWRDLVRAVEEAGATVDDVIPAPLAASHATLSKVQRLAGCVLVNIGSQTTAVAVFEEGLPISLQVFPLGSTDITYDIAIGFQVPLEEAERIKKGESEPVGTKRRLDDIIEARLSDIFDFIGTHLKKIGRNGLLPAGIVITGGGSGINNIEDMAREYFHLPTRLSHPDIASSSRNQIKDTSWSVAYGLCLHYLQEASGGKKSDRPVIKKLTSFFKEFLP